MASRERLKAFIALAPMLVIGPSAVEHPIDNSHKDKPAVVAMQDDNPQERVIFPGDAGRKRPINPRKTEEKVGKKPEVQTAEKSQNYLEQKALKFILPSAQDALDAKIESVTLAEVGNPKFRKKDTQVSRKEKDNKVYATTYFGWSTGYADPEDNYIFKYEDEIRNKFIEEGKSYFKGKRGKELHKAVKYFSAGAGGQFEPGEEIKLTAPNGNVVIVVAADEGPALWAQRQDNKAKFDMSWDAWKALGEPAKVKAEPIPKELEKFIGLGPVKIKKDEPAKKAEVKKEKVSVAQKH